MSNLDPNTYKKAQASAIEHGEEGTTFLVRNPEETTRHRAGRTCSDCGGYKQTQKVGKKYLCRSCRQELGDNSE